MKQSSLRVAAPDAPADSSFLFFFIMSNTFKGFAAGIIAAIFYGTNPLGTLFLYQDEINPTSVLVWRYAIASLLFLAWMVAKRESFHLRLGPAIRMAVLGTFMAMSSATLYLSFKYMDAGIASTILFSYPIITAVLMTAFFHERITWSTTFSILLAVTGIGLLYRGGDNATLSTVGVALVLLSSLFYAFYIIGVNQTHTGLSAIQFTFWVVLFGLISLLVLSVIMGEQSRCSPLRSNGPVLPSWPCCPRCSASTS